MDLLAITKRFISIVTSLEGKGLIKSKSQLAERLGTHKQSLTEILNGKRNVTIELLSKICEHFYANPSYLLMGHSPLFVNPEVEVNNISFVPLKVQAGYKDEIDNPIFEEELEKFKIPGKLFSNDEYRCFEVEGDSMEPVLFKGESVICSGIAPIYFAQGLRDNQIYVVVEESGLVVKKIENNIKIDGTIRLISFNQSYEDRIVPITQVKEMWKVEGKITNRVN